MKKCEDIEKDWKIFRECHVCWKTYPATLEFFNKNKVCLLWLDYRCNNCRKQYHTRIHNWWFIPNGQIINLLDYPICKRQWKSAKYIKDLETALSKRR
jgi:hypothetical protein